MMLAVLSNITVNLSCCSHHVACNSSFVKVAASPNHNERFVHGMETSCISSAVEPHHQAAEQEILEWEDHGNVCMQLPARAIWMAR